MELIPDAPDIARTLRDGYPKEPKYPYCPVCGQPCFTVYRNSQGEIVGCDECIEEQDAWEVL